MLEREQGWVAKAQGSNDRYEDLENIEEYSVEARRAMGEETVRRMRVAITEEVEAKEQHRGRREGRREMLY